VGELTSDIDSLKKGEGMSVFIFELRKPDMKSLIEVGDGARGVW
jgi:hypothetical protein